MICYNLSLDHNKLSLNYHFLTASHQLNVCDYESLFSVPKN
jgi:hypothetical protein